MFGTSLFLWLGGSLAAGAKIAISGGSLALALPLLVRLTESCSVVSCQELCTVGSLYGGLCGGVILSVHLLRQLNARAVAVAVALLTLTCVSGGSISTVSGIAVMALGLGLPLVALAAASDSTGSHES